MSFHCAGPGDEEESDISCAIFVRRRGAFVARVDLIEKFVITDVGNVKDVNAKPRRLNLSNF